MSPGRAARNSGHGGSGIPSEIQRAKRCAEETGFRMRRLDIAILVTIGPLWLITTLFALDRIFSDHPPALFPVYVESAVDPGGVPTVRGFLPWDAHYADFGLADGDRLLEIAGHETAGMGLLDVLHAANSGASAHGECMRVFAV